ncbi:valine--tRNA ligase [Picrophilus oshimae]|uniref:Valine--tRNA ligase n=1 Tax=Picrophilus torridus (strain ATCC 700027 / DSM 9790 / JCM 10055 / NBRC 100828 / KAW 2/3) TaxID=1122961 RepID=SYV_PICTO|nr:valine--tRNA ligase [Picrophilus oshimae]Q6L1N5.1 RecName: Full=Valine--tRNA ligase; AltName: Full=Valyl-tRNA synthetase; Short=ValRS [Picrophilus oshimae DSM 9789]AAT43117.1 valyl-tRNA synthetase [Picrophilus oshimae DSM 9789]
MLDINEMENKWKDYWFNNDVFKFRPGNKIFIIDTPPPTVSGKMHMGHAYSYPHQDFMARYMRMKGFSVYYPWGFDDNGLPTERYVEKERHVTIRNTPLDEYIKICREASRDAEKILLKNWYDLGLSCDFKNYIETSSDFSTRISQELFIDLVLNNRAYRAEAPVIRCPTCNTAISQIDMKDTEIDTDLVYINFSGIEIATTRPELLGACVALVVNPNDPRYKKIINSEVVVPLYNYTVRIISDDSIDMNFGTGAEMLCTFGDQHDLELWRKYNPGTRIIIKNDLIDDGIIIKGLSVKEARKEIIKKLKENNYLIKTERIKHSVNTHERCGTPVEIIISKQWYIKDLDIKDELLDLGNRIEWIPDYMKTRYQNWVSGLKWDWCISRQRYYGIPFPVWYCKDCGGIVLADKSELPVDPRLSGTNKRCSCGSGNLEPETDVMDTWATSSISVTLYLMHINSMNLYPADVRFQGHDIITSWAFTTILRSYLHYRDVPWKKIFISGNVYDPYGEKMSKSKGNIIEPSTIIEKYGADALRFWASTTMPGENIKIREQDLVRGRKTVIKLYNSARLVLMLSDNIKGSMDNIISQVNRWILTKFEKTLKNVTELMDGYYFSRARSELDNFFWNIFCDNYLEIIKSEIKRYPEETAAVSRFLMENIIKMYSPIMPFITEELYHEFNKDSLSVSLEKYPEYNEDYIFDGAEDFDYIIDIINKIRAIKSNMKMSMAAPISISLKGNEKIINDSAEIIKSVMHVENLKISNSDNIEIEVQ